MKTNEKSKKETHYALLGADNVGTDIQFQLYGSYEAAYKAMTDDYEELIEEEDRSVEKADISENKASVMLNDGDYYYWNIKEFEI